MPERVPAVMSWSGGKDSALALQEVLVQEELEIVALLTTVSKEFGRISHHGVREQLLDEQAAAIGLPLHKVYLPSMESRPCTDTVYEDIMGEQMRSYRDQGVLRVVFGDIYLEDLRAYRESNLDTVGMRGVFPLWKRNTNSLIRSWLDSGFKAIVCCAECMFDESYVGVELDSEFVSRLPNDVDPCGENGEFHSFVFDGPIFKNAIDVVVGERVTRDGRFYADLHSESSRSATLPAPLMPPIR